MIINYASVWSVTITILQSKFMHLSSYDHSFIVQATIITIVNYDCTVISIVNYDRKTFLIQAAGHP
jgi:hypothetical protein